MTKERYKSIDGIRGYACIGIVLMHVLANGKFKLSGFVFERFIPSLTNLTYLFMLVSAFSMCCGYYNKFKAGEINLEQFYKRRYKRIWPFFALLCTVDLLITHSVNSLYEWFADLTLVFGLIPNNNISVIGVGWFLGTVFVFYMIFPFYVFLIDNKKRAWMVMFLCIILHYLCNVRFTEANGRTNIVYSSIFFMAGGLIFLYREMLDNSIWKKWIEFVTVLGSGILYYAVSNRDIFLLVLYSGLTMIAINYKGEFIKRLLQNRVIIFISSISMEIYLCHMLVYRFLEKIDILHITKNELLNYLCSCVVTILGAVALSITIKKMMDRIVNMIKAKLRK